MSQIVSAICKNQKGNYIQTCQIGAEAINWASIQQGDKLNVVVGDYAYVNCRK